ncbi:methionine ABC transporter permease [Oscillibacter sp.]|jgi:D-methionine transport system permease protein|uniref:methionine ABC transporter permease n=2 Tax=Oscillibacter TaxID=459786 RepID=UPI0025E4673A|nr:methionine ABC transporter permease [Oscillibacter sp.]
MSEALIQVFESWGIAKVPEQIAYLSDFGELAFSVWETVYAPALATLFAYVIGLPLGIILVIGETGGVRPMPKVLMRILNTIVNLLRSVPFLILMVMVVPLSRLILGTSVGTAATVVPLTVAAAPYVARLVEISLREMDRGVVEAAQSMGCSPWQIVTKVMLPECRPSLINGATNAAITILGYGAMAGAIGGGGLGAVALMRGHGRNQVIVMYVAVIILVILVQIIQSIGTAWSVKSDRRINPTETKRRT